MLNHADLKLQENIITDKKQLAEIFFAGIKPSETAAKKQTGVEFEKLPVKIRDYKAASYYDVAKFLQLYNNNDKQPVYENNALLGLSDKDGVISLEPGSQTELSLVPKDNLIEVKKYIDNYNKNTAQLAQKAGICWLGYGIQPVSTYEQINIIPKKRYEYMTKYLPTVAKKPLIMMRETAGIQASFDYTSEQDAMRKFSFAIKLSPIVSAIFANSPVRNGRLTNYKSNRAASWLETDNDRCGLVSEKVFTEKFSFDDYIEILLDVPMIFIERFINGKKTAIQTGNITFRQFLNQGWQGFIANKQDWETHLSLYFPDVRFKSYIEIRNHDNQRTELICAVPALWKCLIYNNEAMKAVENLLKEFTYQDFEYIRNETPRYALDLEIKNRSLKDIAKEIVDISYNSLKTYAKSEETLLEPLKELVYKGITPADVIIDKWENNWNKDVSKLVEYSILK